MRYESHGRARKGVASNYVAERLKRGGRVRVKLQAEQAFRAAGAGQRHHHGRPRHRRRAVPRLRAGAPRRPARRAEAGCSSATASFTHDFLYQLDWQDALKDGALTRMDVAFSRDTPEKVYVQHRMWERRRDLVEWLDDGAYFYVCGDAKAMAKDVRATLVRAYADVKALSPEAAEQAVATLERDKRYLQDVPYCMPAHLIGRPDCTHDRKTPSRNERIKEASDYLRGTLAEGLREEITGAHRRGRPAAGEVPRHVSAGRPRPARRAHAQEDGEGLRLHDPRAHPGRRADAAAMARARPGGARLRQRHACA